jgi:signal peptidase I
MVTVLLFVGFCALFLAATAAFVWFAGRRVGLTSMTFQRALGAVAVIAVLWLSLRVGTTLADSSIDLDNILWFLIELLVVVNAVGLLSRWLFRASPAQTLLTWSPGLIPLVLSFPLITFVIEPYCLEATALHSMSMAPTLLGPHQMGTCPHCGAHAYVPFKIGPRRGELPLGICSSCGQSGPIASVKPDVLQPDVFVVNKLIPVRRWDLVAYWNPRARDNRQVKRVVGLPGEEVVIRNGRIHIDGTPLEPPPELAGVLLESGRELSDGVLWGSPEHPAKLAADEYFVIGDFCKMSSDSRVWDVGVDGHPPFALPASYIDGVVTLVHWPQTRWRLIR